ncbi:MAG: HK97 family phage prohead protease [Alphaproteobacteria bacterium]|nr:HK97 family phage prohead protease [Alphaproteobacteria bacterium]
MNTKMHKLNLKSINDDGTFEGYASVFNYTDHHGDCVEKGAFAKSITKLTPKKLKMLWQHNQEKPIGVWESVYEDDYGLYVKGRLLLDVEQAREAYSFLKAGVIEGLSIGYMPVQHFYDPQKKATILKEVDLLEISLVTFGANDQARVTNVKKTNSIAERLNNIKAALEYLLKTVMTSTALY